MVQPCDCHVEEHGNRCQVISDVLNSFVYIWWPWKGPFMSGPEKDRVLRIVHADGPCLAGVTISNVLQDVQICQMERRAETFSPHEFIQVARYHSLRCAVHSFEHRFSPWPVTLHVIGVGSSYRVDEVLAVVNGAMLVVSGQTGDAPICRPLIGNHNGTGCHNPFNDGQQCPPIPLWNKGHVADLLGNIIHTEYPAVRISQIPSSTILGLDK